jgi:hypothetical protein
VSYRIADGTAKPIAETQINIIPNNNNVSLFRRCGCLKQETAIFLSTDNATNEKTDAVEPRSEQK